MLVSAAATDDNLAIDDFIAGFNGAANQVKFTVEGFVGEGGGDGAMAQVRFVIHHHDAVGALQLGEYGGGGGIGKIE